MKLLLFLLLSPSLLFAQKIGYVPVSSGGGGGSSSASDLTSGTLPDARLSSNVPIKNGTNAFTGTNSFSSAPTVSGSALVNATQLATKQDALTAGTGIAISAGTISASYGTSSTTAAAGNDSRITGAAQKASNLSDLASASTARTNLGLGTIATQSASAISVGTIAGTGDITIPGLAMKAGDAGHTGFLGYYNSDGSRKLYMGYDGSNQLTFYFDTADGVYNFQNGNIQTDGYLRTALGIYLPPRTAPGTPGTGFVLYTDSADGKLKVKGSDGVVTSLTP